MLPRGYTRLHRAHAHAHAAHRTPHLPVTDFTPHACLCLPRFMPAVTRFTPVTVLPPYLPACVRYRSAWFGWFWFGYRVRCYHTGLPACRRTHTCGCCGYAVLGWVLVLYYTRLQFTGCVAVCGYTTHRTRLPRRSRSVRCGYGLDYVVGLVTVGWFTLCWFLRYTVLYRCYGYHTLPHLLPPYALYLHTGSVYYLPPTHLFIHTRFAGCCVGYALLHAVARTFTRWMPRTRLRSVTFTWFAFCGYAPLHTHALPLATLLLFTTQFTGYALHRTRVRLPFLVTGYTVPQLLVRCCLPVWVLGLVLCLYLRWLHARAAVRYAFTFANRTTQFCGSRFCYHSWLPAAAPPPRWITGCYGLRFWFAAGSTHGYTTVRRPRCCGAFAVHRYACCWLPYGSYHVYVRLYRLLCHTLPAHTHTCGSLRLRLVVHVTAVAFTPLLYRSGSRYICTFCLLPVLPRSAGYRCTFTLRYARLVACRAPRTTHAHLLPTCAFTLHHTARFTRLVLACTLRTPHARLHTHAHARIYTVAFTAYLAVTWFGSFVTFTAVTRGCYRALMPHLPAWVRLHGCGYTCCRYTAQLGSVTFSYYGFCGSTADCHGSAYDTPHTTVAFLRFIYAFPVLVTVLHGCHVPFTVHTRVLQFTITRCGSYVVTVLPFPAFTYIYLVAVTVLRLYCIYYGLRLHLVLLRSLRFGSYRSFTTRFAFTLPALPL